MQSDRDIVDAIDELVDWQLAKEPSGWDHNINQARCPHWWCDADFHPLPIKQRMREIRQLWRSAVAYYEDEERVPEQVVAELDEYRYDIDESPVICPGSLFEGEFTPPAPPPYTPGPREALHAAMLMYGDLMAAATGLSADFWQLPDDPAFAFPNPFLPSGIGGHGLYQPQPWSWSWSGETVTLVERRTIEAEADAVAAGEPIGQSFKDAADSYLRAAAEQGITDLDPAYVHVRIDETRSTSTHYALIATYKPPRSSLTVRPDDVAVRLWRADPDSPGDGWQELGTVDATALRFTPITEPSPEARAIASTPGDQAA